MRTVASWLRSFRHHLRPAADIEFLDSVYELVLGRPPDAVGRTYWLGRLARGASHDEVITSLLRSEEFAVRASSGRFDPTTAVQEASAELPSLRERAPDRYATIPFDDGRVVDVLRCDGDADLLWIERQIIELGYYEEPGVWGLVMDDDKRRLASLIKSFEPERVLEIGCSNGAVLALLHDEGVDVTGLEISHRAMRHAFPQIRDHIILSDLLAADLEGRSFSVIAGFDVFEHLHPSRLPAYLAALRTRLLPDGVLLANVPALGDDPSFGEIFPIDSAAWREDAARGEHFHDLVVDDKGFPMHGHLIWADWRWWTNQFEQAGFVRLRDVEAQIQDEFGEVWRELTPARGSMFVLARDPDVQQEMLERRRHSARREAPA